MELHNCKALTCYTKGYNIKKIEKFKIYSLIFMSIIHTKSNSAKS